MSTGAVLLQPLTKCILHSFGGLVLHVKKHVATGIEGDGDAGVAEHLGDYLRVDIPAEKPRGRRVPWVVEANGGEQRI